MRATVYGIPGSHPTRAGTMMLDRKGIEWRRRDLPNGASRPILRMLGFPGVTVPAVRIDGRKVQTTRALARALDEIVPEPPLFPADPDRRAAVESAEQWGDEVLQPVPRRLSWAALSRNRKPLASFLDGAVLGIPPKIAAATGGPLVKLGVRLNGAHDDAVRADLLTLPVLLDQVDDLIANGVVGGEEPNAADYQILTSVRLLMVFEDLAPLLDGRPATAAARRLVPDYSGHMPAVFPREWLPVLGEQ